MTVLLAAETYTELLALKGDAGADKPVSVSRKGQAARMPTLPWEIVLQAAKRASLEQVVSPLCLQYGHPSHSLELAAPISFVQECMGHSSAAVTGKYAHASPGESSALHLPKKFG